MIEPRGEWIALYGGNRAYLYDIQPGEIFISDIARALSHIARFGGHTPWHYSVAQHSILVAEELERTGYTYRALWGLLHDAAEAYIGDVVRPIKRMPTMVHFCNLEDVLLRKIAARFSLPVVPPQASKHVYPDVVAAADEAVLAAEWDKFFPQIPRTAPGCLCPGDPAPCEIRMRDAADVEIEFMSTFERLDGYSHYIS
jgi:hypothetical protein